MQILSKNLEVTRGDTAKYRLKILTSNDVEITTNDITNIYFSVKENFKNTDVLLQKQLNDGITLGEDGYYHIVISSTDTDELSFGDYYYDIQLNITNEKYTIVKGIFKIDWEITDVESE